MKHVGLLACAIFACLLTASPAFAADDDEGGLLGNSYASQMRKLGDDKLRITTRKRVRGSLEEATKPGTSVYEALASIQQAASLRACIEAKNLGYDVVEVLGARNLSTAEDRRGTDKSPGGVNEKDFTWGGSQHYTQSVELVIEVTIGLIDGPMPENPPASYIDVNQVLIQYGLAEVS
jgi:hypothetical protein